MLPPSDQCYEAAKRKDARFDGWIYCGVTSTGIYCRPSCPARTPKSKNLRFFASAAAAQSEGFRACKRCRPDASPGSPEWDSRGDLVGRAMRLIADGVVDREGVAGLAAMLAFSERHLHRQLVEVVGAGPLALARANRAQNARILLETTDLPIAEVAFSAGFGSVRQFNDTVRAVFAESPRRLRNRRVSTRESGSRSITLRLPNRSPIAIDELFDFLRVRAIVGVERSDECSYARNLDLPRGAGRVVLVGAEGHVRASFTLAQPADLGAAVERVRRLLDLDADPAAADAVLARDLAMRPLIRATPGLRVPGCVSGSELAVRAVLGQQVSVASARRAGERLSSMCAIPADLGAAQQLVGKDLPLQFPDAETISELDPATLRLPKKRARTLVELAGRLARGEIVLDGSDDRQETRSALLDVPGIGQWTADYIAMRAMRDPDVFLPSDAGVRRGLERLGFSGDPAQALALSARWRPYRSNALMHLWHHQAPQQTTAQ